MERKVCERCGEAYVTDPRQSLCLPCQVDSGWYDTPPDEEDPEEGEGGPDEGDYITEDHYEFYQFGKLAVTVPEGEDWEPYVRWHMQSECHWPNVWLRDDHGGFTLLSLDS